LQIYFAWPDLQLLSSQSQPPKQPGSQVRATGVQLSASFE
jgi:hypothetical protein